MDIFANIRAERERSRLALELTTLAITEREAELVGLLTDRLVDIERAMMGVQESVAALSAAVATLGDEKQEVIAYVASVAKQVSDLRDELAALQSTGVDTSTLDQLAASITDSVGAIHTAVGGTPAPDPVPAPVDVPPAPDPAPVPDPAPAPVEEPPKEEPVDPTPTPDPAPAPADVPVDVPPVTDVPAEVPPA